MIVKISVNTKVQFSMYDHEESDRTGSVTEIYGNLYEIYKVCSLCCFNMI